MKRYDYDICDTLRMIVDNDGNITLSQMSTIYQVVGNISHFQWELYKLFDLLELDGKTKKKISHKNFKRVFGG